MPRQNLCDNNFRSGKGWMKFYINGNKLMEVRFTNTTHRKKIMNQFIDTIAGVDATFYIDLSFQYYEKHKNKKPR